MQTKKQIDIAVLLDREIQYGRDILHGIMSFVRAKTSWVIHTHRLSIKNLRKRSASSSSGIIVQSYCPEIIQTIDAFSIPAVCIGSNWGNDKIPSVNVDNVSVGKLAGKHFVERGFTNFGYFGGKKSNKSNQRESGFAQILHQHGYDYRAFYKKIPLTSYTSEILEADNNQLCQYLLSLPKPAAIFVYNDYRALMVNQACNHLDIGVPEEVAILGVDNDADACNLGYPPLSSIDMPKQQLGFEAMKMLHKLICGEKLIQQSLSFTPLRVVVRLSSDITAISDPDLILAMRFIREHVDTAITVEDICDQLTISRRKLEKLMKDKFGRSPLKEINRAHVERAKKLLAETNMKMPGVAAASGFNSPERLCVIFHRMTGLSPTDYRKRFHLLE